MQGPVSVDIIILSYARSNELKALTNQTLNTLFNSKRRNDIQFNVIVIESEKTVVPYEFSNTTTIYPTEEFGYNRYINIGISITQNPYICICNNDLLFSDNWATEIIEAFERYPQLKSASPICTIQHPSKGFHPHTGDYFGYETRKEVSGWCLFFKREMIETIGMFDEKFKFWFADDDYASTLKKHGLQHALVTSSLVDHLESQTIAEFDQIKRGRLTDRERFYYEYKWGKRSYFSYLFRLYKFYKKEWTRN